MSARKEALNILYRVMQEDGYASLLMRETKLRKEDIPFVTNLVYGVLRNYSFLEFQWREYTKRVKPKVALALDMAVYELFFMHSKEYAVVNEMVTLMPDHEKKFVNAILRKVLKCGLRENEEPYVKFSHPEWIYNMWRSHYGQDIALKIMEADQLVPQVYGRINLLKTSKDELMKDSAVHFIDELSFIMDVPIQSTSYFKEGKVLIQNPSSILPVLELDLQDNLRVLDVCAAPGTKTQLISSFMHNRGKVIACDKYEHRCELIKQLMDRCGNQNVETVVNDATIPSFEKDSFDRILCDVPCSGLGDLSHKPEIRWHLSPADIDEITKIQEQILDVSSTYLKKDGVLVYSTCTLNRKENTKQIENFLINHPDFSVIKERTVFPFEKDHDGFYIAKFVKR